MKIWLVKFINDKNEVQTQKVGVMYNLVIQIRVLM